MAWATARAGSSVTTSPSPSAFTRSNTPTDWSARTMRRAAWRRRAARAIDEPISPTPMIANSSKIGSASGCPSRSTTFASHELRERGDYALVRLFAANRQTQQIRQAIGRDRPEVNPRALKNASAPAAVRPDCLGKVDDRKFPTLGVTSDSERGCLLRQPGQPARIVRDRAFDMRRIANTCDACRLPPPRLD